ncbi:Uma2 family endonuclease [Synechococcus sp. PCC 7336]|uniref:Uma2 family endonuclease n=1 Tax=Synechococcus sp. PCC 7336 TaxID=195250 RepID=UPI000347D63D|nr:Uma2 family endonuclease [Synechococcus sp. PCC 7336]
MTAAKPSLPQYQHNPLPSMYDLPSEDPAEPGLPDEFHNLQPQLLSATLRLSQYAPDNRFTGTDLNLYYDIRHPLWHKRPDWFLVLGVPRLYGGADLRLSYVIWQERVSPSVVVELLSPGTEREDLGETERQADRPPTKWEVYEQILKVPYYVVFDRYTDQLRAFELVGGSYQPLEIAERRLWIPALDLGLGVWQGEYEGIERAWLRWYSSAGDWIPTDTETAAWERQRAEQQQQRAEQQQQRAEQAESLLEQERQDKENLLAYLRSLGVDPDELERGRP